MNKMKDNYDAFVDKFKPKKTTDDCYTPPQIYEAVCAWVENEYKVNRRKFIRPFYTGGDYKNHQYPAGGIVVDNPPFSIMKQIVEYYVAKDIKFFLFCPGLTSIRMCTLGAVLGVGASLTYENGAKVSTSFITNLEECGVRSAPTLYRAIKDADTKAQKESKREVAKYEYPNNVLTAAKVNYLSKYGVDFHISKSEAVYIDGLDSQKEKNKKIFGGGLLLAEKAAAEKAAAEKAAAEKLKLSEREWDIIHALG